MAIVTISRSSGSGGESIGKAVAHKLGYEYVDKKSFFAEIEKHGNRWLKWGKDLDEHRPTLWERFDRSFAGIVSLVEDCVYQYALKNNVVIVGRGGNWLLRDVPYGLRIRVTAPTEDRIKRVGDREKVNRETAERMIEFSDHERSCYIKSVYRRDWNDPADYDKVFDMGSLGFDEVVRRILEEIPERDKRVTPEALEKLRKLALAAKVKAEISTDFQVFVPTLEVIHDESAIVVRGVIRTPEERKRVLDIAHRIAAPTKVQSDLHYRGA